MPVIKLESELVQAASARFTRKFAGVELFIKGFASIEGLDRHGEKIPADVFDVKTFLANPQLWFNHDLYVNAKGQQVPIGTVERMHTVKAVETASEEFDLKDLDTGAFVDHVSNSDGFLLKNGDRGLWVVAKVIEPEVIALVEDRRLNAFSWAGAMLRRPDGKVAKIDIREVSLVYLPANARALFTVGKDLKGDNSLFAINGSTVFAVNEECVKLATLSREGSRFKFLVRPSGAGHTKVMTPISEIADEDHAKKIAKEYATACLQCAVFENAWKRTEDGVQIYKLAHVENGVLDETHEMIKRVMPAEAWPKAYVDSLPKQCFAYVAPDGNRLFPYRDVNGALSEEAVKRAIAEACSSPFYESALPVLKQAAIDLGMEEWLRGGGQSPLTAEEQRLFGLSAEFPITDTQSEGGDEQMNADEILKAINGIGAKLDEMGKRIDGIEQSKAAEEAVEEGSDEGVTEKDADVSQTKKKKSVDKKLVDVAEFTSEKSADAEEAEEDDAEEGTKALQAIILQSFKDVGKRLEKIETRLGKVESTPLKSKQIREDEASSEDDGELTEVALAKMLREATPAQRKAAEAQALDKLLFGPHRERTRAEKS